MISRSLFLAPFLLLPAAVWAAAPKSAAEPPLVVEAHLTIQKLASVAGGKDGLTLPQLRAYDREGRLLHDFGTGFAPSAFTSTLDTLVAHPLATDGVVPTLAQELDGVVDARDEPLAMPRATGLVFVEYWADWCQPCHAQFNALTAYLESHRHPEVTLLHVEMAFHATVSGAEPHR